MGFSCHARSLYAITNCFFSSVSGYLLCIWSLFELPGWSSSSSFRTLVLTQNFNILKPEPDSLVFQDINFHKIHLYKKNRNCFGRKFSIPAFRTVLLDKVTQCQSTWQVKILVINQFVSAINSMEKIPAAKLENYAFDSVPVKNCRLSLCRLYFFPLLYFLLLKLDCFLKFSIIQDRKTNSCGFVPKLYLILNRSS